MVAKIIMTKITCLFVFQPDDGLWYRPKYRIIEVRNKWSRFSLKLELFQQLNTKITCCCRIVSNCCKIWGPLSKNFIIIKQIPKHNQRKLYSDSKEISFISNQRKCSMLLFRNMCEILGYLSLSLVLNCISFEWDLHFFTATNT